MPRAGFEPTIPVFERSKTVFALDRAANGTGVCIIIIIIIIIVVVVVVVVIIIIIIIIIKGIKFPHYSERFSTSDNSKQFCFNDKFNQFRSIRKYVGLKHKSFSLNLIFFLRFFLRNITR
jgi:hypothetical protein